MKFRSVFSVIKKVGKFALPFILEVILRKRKHPDDKIDFADLLDDILYDLIIQILNENPNATDNFIMSRAVFLLGLKYKRSEVSTQQLHDIVRAYCIDKGNLEYIRDHQQNKS